jgi:serine/threonine protein kinase
VYYIIQLLDNPFIFWGLLAVGLLVGYQKLAHRLRIRVPWSGLDLTPEALLAKFVPSYAEAKTQKKIDTFKKNGDFLAAGRILEEENRVDEAITAYTEGGEFFVAATLLEKQGKLEKAGELYVQADDTKKAAQVFSQAGKHVRAAELFKERGNTLDAARLYGMGGQWDKAAALYDKGGYPARAAEAYEKCGELLKAAEGYEKHFMENVSYSTTYSSTATSPDQKSALLSGRLYEKLGDMKRALEIYQKGSYFKEAASACLRLGQHAKAAELYMRAEEPSLAADAYEKGGDPVQAANLRGEVALKAGKQAEAAGFFLQGRDHLRSAELYESINMLAEAAKAYEAADSYAAAGNVYVRAGLKERAAESYERGGDFETAAKLYEEAGNSRKAIELFDRAGYTFKSGDAAAKAGDFERAISLLQRVPPNDENYASATESLADVFIRTGRPLLAAERVQKVLAGQGIGAHNLGLYYWLAAAHEAAGKADEALALYKKVQAEDLHFRDVDKRVMRVLTGMSMPSLPGADAGTIDRMGKYTLGPKIGQGAMGEVFRAHDPLLKRDVAIKMISATLAPDSDMRQRFEREAQAAARLSHTNIVTVYEYGQEKGKIYMVMELLEGCDLRSAINRNMLPTLEQKLGVMEQVSEGLAYAHSREIVHRDLKPGNIHVLPSGQAKILDFGLARLGSSEMTQSGVIMGTPNYMSPEQVRGERVDMRSDVFSLGSVFYELLSNRKAFDAESMHGVLYHVLHDEPEPVRRWVPDLPEPLIEFIEKALAKDPEKRFPDGAAMRQALKPVRKLIPGSMVVKPSEAAPRAPAPPETPVRTQLETPTRPSVLRGATLIKGPTIPPGPASESHPPPAPSAPSPVVPSPATPPPAGRGARFIPQEEIGRGPKGVVYRGGDSGGAAVALRFLNADVLKAEGALSALAADLKGAAPIVHPNLVKLIGFVEINGQRCVVTELVPGKSFAEPLKGGKRVPFAHALGLARVLAETLALIHGRGLVHGGVQPANLMAAGSVVKLADLGLGRVFQLTSGAREYWPAGARFEASTDLYAMAATLYHLITGTKAGPTPKPPSTVVAGVPPAFDGVLLRALDGNPAQRYPSAAAFLEALGNLGGRG